LQSFYLGDSHLTGSIPEEISLLTSLRKLDLGGNSFVGPIPDSIGNLRNLVTLNLPSTHLNGSIPASLGNCSSLQVGMLIFELCICQISSIFHQYTGGH
jgi:Leucine-rich repeat (LRR) protein